MNLDVVLSWVVWNNLGEAMGAIIDRKVAKLTLRVTKLLAIRYGLNFSLGNGFRRIMLESNSLKAVQVVKQLL